MEFIPITAAELQHKPAVQASLQSPQTPTGSKLSPTLSGTTAAVSEELQGSL